MREHAETHVMKITNDIISCFVLDGKTSEEIVHDIKHHVREAMSVGSILTKQTREQLTQSQKSYDIIHWSTSESEGKRDYESSKKG